VKKGERFPPTGERLHMTGGGVPPKQTKANSTKLNTSLLFCWPQPRSPSAWGGKNENFEPKRGNPRDGHGSEKRTLDRIEVLSPRAIRRGKEGRHWGRGFDRGPLSTTDGGRRRMRIKDFKKRSNGEKGPGKLSSIWIFIEWRKKSLAETLVMDGSVT